MTVAPPRPTRLLSRRMTDAPFRAAAMAAYIPAPPAPTISTAVVRWGITAGPGWRLSGARCARPIRSLRERIGTKLKMHRERFGTFAVLHQPRRAVTARTPQAATFPAGFRVVYATVEPFGIKAQRIGHGQQNHLAVFQRNQAMMQVSGGHWHVFAKPERVVLVDPRIVARLCAVLADSFKSRPRVLIKCPAFGAMIASRFRSVERTLAFSPVEAGEMTARERRPDNSLLVDVGAADAKTGQRNIIDFRQSRLRGI